MLVRSNVKRVSQSRHRFVSVSEWAEASLREQIDTVVTAKKFLIEHPEACKVNHPSHGGTGGKRPQGGGSEHEHGSLNCVVAFLGDANWSRSKIGRISEAANNVGGL